MIWNGSNQHDPSVVALLSETTMTVRITRLEHDASSLRRCGGQHGREVARRLLAIALVLDGRTRTEAARSCGMDRQILRDWVIRYNEQGIDGLADQHGGGAGAQAAGGGEGSWRNGCARAPTGGRPGPLAARICGSG